MKSDEEILREEIRALRELILKLYQWGVAFLASLQAAIFFIRKEVLTGLIENGRLQKGDILPAWRYFIGTVVVLLIATFFQVLSQNLSRQLRFYQTQLRDKRSSGVEDLTTDQVRRRLLRIMVISLYYLFPGLDIIGRFLFR